MTRTPAETSCGATWREYSAGVASNTASHSRASSTLFSSEEYFSAPASPTSPSFPATASPAQRSLVRSRSVTRSWRREDPRGLDARVAGCADDADDRLMHGGA